LNLDRSVLAVVRGRATSGDLVGDRLAMICFSRRVGEIRVLYIFVMTVVSCGEVLREAAVMFPLLRCVRNALPSCCWT
jgi:hypothetical protein